MRHNLLIAISEFAAKKPIHLLVMALIVTLIAAASASKLELVMHVKNLMPEEHPMIKEFNQIIDDYSTASMIIIAARGEEDELKQFADEIAPRVKALKKFVNRVDYKLNRDFSEARHDVTENQGLEKQQGHLQRPQCPALPHSLE